MKKISILIADDHQIYRDGIKSYFSSSSNFEVKGEASDETELLEKVKELSPEIIILDIQISNSSGMGLIKNLTKNYPESKVIIFSTNIYEDLIFNSIKAGAKSYLQKGITKKEFIKAINEVYEGNEFFSESISKIMLNSYITKAKSEDDLSKKRSSLSEREVEILKYVVEEKTNLEIANKLFISVRTVESHKNHIMKKLKFNSPYALVKYAIKNKIIDVK